VSGRVLEQVEKLVGAIRGLATLFDDERRLTEAALANPLQVSQLPLTDHASDVQATLRRDTRRETAFCDAYDSLIALARSPEIVGQVERIAAVLREYRLVQVRWREAEMEDLSPAQMPPPPELAAQIDGREHRRWLMEMSRQVTEWTNQRIERSQLRRERAAVESEQLLRTAVEQAEQLLEAARGTA
jgi:hypothetical protein